jgi:acyl-coenzyme A thioesterase 9
MPSGSSFKSLRRVLRQSLSPHRKPEAQASRLGLLLSGSEKRRFASTNQESAPSKPKGKSSSNPAIVSLFKNPIVHQLWTARQEAKERSALARQANKDQTGNTGSAAISIGKAPSESRVEVSYPFSTDELLLEAYKNPWGAMRFGKILEDLDALAGNIAFFHADDSASGSVVDHPVIVTASVDRICLRQRPQVGTDQSLSGQVTWTGSSSMEIRMQCRDASATSSVNEEWLEAFVTFVTLDPITKKPIPVPPVRPQTAEEKALLDAGAARAALRKKRRQQQNYFSPELDSLAQSLVQKAGPLLKMPSLAEPNSILMSQTTMQNALIAQPQVRNLHNRIFGGYLMRLAFELAFSNAYVFAGIRPVFLEVDHVAFTNPVDVGDLLVFNSRVLYTEPAEQQSLVHIHVEAWVTEPERATAKIANQFYFTFCVPGKSIRNVLPSNTDEARQMVLRMQADTEQSR